MPVKINITPLRHTNQELMGNSFPTKPIIKRPEIKVRYVRLFQWQKEYGKTGMDKKAVDDCMRNENAEYIRSLRTELLSVAKGHYDDHLFQQVIGIARKKRHKSYMAWAKLMLQLMAAHKG